MPCSKMFQASCEKKKQVKNLHKNRLVLNVKTKILSWQAGIIFKSGLYGIYMKVFVINPNLKIKNQMLEKKIAQHMMLLC